MVLPVNTRSKVFYFTNTVCPVCVNAIWKRGTNKCEARLETGFVVPWHLIMTEGSPKGSQSGVYTNLPMPRPSDVPARGAARNG